MTSPDQVDVVAHKWSRRPRFVAPGQR